ncbi:VWA domain-containing protein [Oceanobacillus sp. FSL K6-0127]|uniref:VWA domain-containing protein n=1 Tax=Oceanobacillus sp. FSL K6-0127 TaxID=2921420 RepID=UPI0030EEB6A0
MKKAIILLLGCIFVFSACSKSEETAEPDDTSHVEESEAEEKAKTEWWQTEMESYSLDGLPRDLDELEQELIVEAGLYSGDKYDLASAKDMLDQLPENLSEEELEAAILRLIREDFHAEVETFVTFDPTVEVNVDKPDEELEEPSEEMATSTSHFAILLDASGSMNNQSDGTSRMELAKEAIGNFIDILPANSTVSLRVYGHEGTGSDDDKKLSCRATESLYNGEMNEKEFMSALKGVEPAGWTPIANALEAAEKDIPDHASTAIVYVVSDGIETCDGDPIKVAEQLNQKDVQPIINIIGFQVDDEAQELLEQVAEAGKGEFTYAGNKQDLEDYWEEEYNRLQEAWETWQQEGMKRADELSQQLMEQADETGYAIMGKSELEFDRAEDLINYLTTERQMENANNLWSIFYERSTTIWSYGYDNQTENWGAAYENGNAAWRYFYETGTEKWTEYYNKVN